MTKDLRTKKQGLKTKHKNWGPKKQNLEFKKTLKLKTKCI